jgi:hypothetical protein
MSTLNALSSLKQVVTQISMVGVISIGTVALAHPAQAASLNLTTWAKFGDVEAIPTQATLTNAFSNGLDDAPINRNRSGNDPLLIDDLENALALPLGRLGTDAVEGSAIQTTLTGVMAGDKFGFNWNFQTFDNLFIDRAFVTINNTVFNLTGTNPFSFTFTGAGNYRIAIGVLDVDDLTDSSILTVNNANFTAVPTPALLPGLMAMGLRISAKRRRTPNESRKHQA